MNPQPDSVSVHPSWALDERQRAMLAAMGVAVWWPQPSAPTAPTPATTPEPVKISAKIEAENPILSCDSAVFDSNNGAAPPPTREARLAPQLRHPPDRRPPAMQPTDTLDWDGLAEAVSGCRACGLCDHRQQPVLGTGPKRARWMVVGEAPGEQEDRQGQPFVGPAGQLLDAMLGAMGLNRTQDVYIANVIKCRPPQNRNPQPDEVASCRPYLMRQIELVQPDLVLALGRFAAHALLADTLPDVDRLPLGKLRGQVHRAAGRPVVVSYHPAYLLRSPTEKSKAWADLCLAMAALDHWPPVMG